MIDAPLVRCERVAKTYGSGGSAVVALHGVSCEIGPGQQLAIMGPSGSGKSTLLHLIAGLDTPTSGSVTWPAFGPRRSLRPANIALVLQGPSLLPPLDVVENVAFPLLLVGIDEGEANDRARAALARLDLAGLANKLPEELSGGQAQRVAIARALAQGPRLLLADEPTGQLDHGTATAVVDTLIEAAAHTGAAMVVSTHDPAVGERFAGCWRVADGRLSVDEMPASTSTAAAGSGGAPCSA
ncbi:MAG: transporter ATP-binding protein [Actinomycetia bacterium]|nr:transporter ATP-binding protein [Actinomycetes bacterium]